MVQISKDYDLEKVEVSFNLMSIIFLTLVLFLAAHLGLSKTSLFSSDKVPLIVSIGVILLCFPRLISGAFRMVGWYCISEVIFLVALLLMSVAGLVIKDIGNLGYYFIMLLGLVLLIIEIKTYLKLEVSILTWVIGFISLLTIYFFFYSREYQTLFFIERLIAGNIHVDTLFHVSISEMIGTYTLPSTGLHGSSTYFRYHWLSHGLFAGLSNFSDVSIVTFYNLVYPALFIVLFFKVQFLTIYRFWIWYKGYRIDPVFYFIFWAVAYTLTGVPFLTSMKPLGSETLCTSLIFIYILISTSIEYFQKPTSKLLFAYFYVPIMCLAIAMLKISSGTVISAGAAFILFWKLNNWKDRTLSMLVFLVVALTVYLTIYPSARTEVSMPFYVSLIGIFSSTYGLMFIAISLTVPVYVMFKNENLPIGKMSKIILPEFCTPEAFLLVVSITGIAGAFYVLENNDSDVIHFISVQFFLTCFYFIYYFDRGWDGWLKHPEFRYGLLVLSVLILLSNPRKSFAFYPERKMHVAQSSNLNHDEYLLQQLIDELRSISEYEIRRKRTACIFIPPDETWLFESQTFKPLGSMFIIPALSGVAAIGSIPKEVIKSGYNYYSVYYYRPYSNLLISTIEEAKEEAMKQGFKELLVFREMDDQLSRVTYSL